MSLGLKRESRFIVVIGDVNRLVEACLNRDGMADDISFRASALSGDARRQPSKPLTS
jgi:hypothetical protein